MTNDNPWAGLDKIGALDQKLYEQPKPEPSSSPKPPGAQTRKTEKRVAAAASRPQPAVTPAKPQAQIRKWVRRTYDIYEDQVESLLRLTYERKIAGEETSISDIIREAIDDWINKHSAKK